MKVDKLAKAKLMGATCRDCKNGFEHMAWPHRRMHEVLPFSDEDRRKLEIINTRICKKFKWDEDVIARKERLAETMLFWAK